MQIQPNENDLRGQWVVVDGKMVKDEVTKRIETLTEKYLKRVKAEERGWNTLFCDPSDGRYWELTYPHSEMHGGGPPRLSVIEYSFAVTKYRLG